MNILLLDHISAELSAVLLSDNVIYRPDLLDKSPSIIAAALNVGEVDAVVSRSAIPGAALREWSSSQTKYWVRVVVGDAADPENREPPADRAGPEVLWARGADMEAAYIAAFSLLERNHTQQLARPSHAWVAASGGAKERSVLVIGGGLVNLITAYMLCEEGYRVHLVDGGPDPRSSAPWTAYGCSRGGDDARMFTLSEMDNYNDKSASRDMNSIFNRDVTDLGWSTRRALPSGHEREWMREFESIPVWLANRYNDDIFAFNRESHFEWETWIRKELALFKDSHIREGILRLYSNEAHYRQAVQRQNRIGATRKILSSDDVGRDYPALGSAVEAGHIAGGVLVVGFTINAHKFMRQLLDRLQGFGAEFSWNTRVDKIEFSEAGKVDGVRAGSQKLYAHHYLLSPGCYGGSVLTGTKSEAKIHGVLGAWLRLPNTQPMLELSLKLARKNHITEDANITVATDEAGEPIMIIGSGYGHTGIDPGNIDRALLFQVYGGLVDTAEKYFPRAYKSAVAGGSLERSLKYCVRPWTSTGLGIFEILPSKGGGTCVINGGHNTGGFAQAPSIGRAVLAAFEHRDHPMHTHYHPDRAPNFLRPAAPAVKPSGRTSDEGRAEPIAPIAATM